MEYKPGDLVKHPKRPDWGVGRVDLAGADGVISITFSRAGAKQLHLKRVPLQLEKLRRTIDSIIIYHREFLEFLGKPYKGTRSSQGTRNRRITHCYSCKSHLDNSVNVECVNCSWIICWCGACGCGYAGRGNA